MHVNRRQFLRTGTCGIAAAAGLESTGALSALAAEPIAAPTTIIDTHTHFYDPSRPGGVPWPPKNNKLLYRTVLPKDYRALKKPHAVKGTVVVEASERLEDNQWILDLAADDPFIVGFVGRLSPGEDGFREHLARFAKNPLFRGIRIREVDIVTALEGGRTLDDLRRLADADLAIDALGRPTMLPHVAALAEKIPALRIVIDHVANVAIDGKKPPGDWYDGMRECADHVNVFCKVSALAEGAARDGRTAPKEVAFYRPVLDALWELFGAEQLIYGSNWPVSDRAADYYTVQRIVEEYFGGKGRDAVDKYFFQNAQAAYKWVDRNK